MSVFNETKKVHASVPAGWRLLENPARVELGDLVWNCAAAQFQASEDLRPGDVAAHYYAVIRKEAQPAAFLAQHNGPRGGVGKIIGVKGAAEDKPAPTPAPSSPSRPIKTWWMVLNPYASGGKPTRRHETLASAKEEAMRLARKDGLKTHVLQLVGTAHPPKQPEAKWEDRA